MQRSSQIVILVAVLIVLGISAFFMANVAMPPWAALVSAPSVILFALPTMWAAKMWLGWRDSLILFTVLGLFALVVELAAATTGIPYGHFGYSDHLGYRLFDKVPWTVAFAWTPLVLAAYGGSAKLFAARFSRVLMTAMTLVVLDLVLDPGAVYLGFWKYADGGVYYGVPVSNYVGWAVSGLAGAILTEFVVSLFKPLLPVPVQLMSGALLIVFFWTIFAAFAGMFLPAAVGITVLSGMIVVWRRYHFAFDDMIVLVDEANDPIGTAPRTAAHDRETKLHRAFSVFLFNRRGEVLLQQRSLRKKTWPGVWSNSCCGHVMLHERTERAAARRLNHELGLNGIELTTALPDFRYRAEKDGVVENEVCPVLIGMTEREPVINPTEVSEIRWVEWNAFVASLEEPGTEISPWAIEEARLLANSAIFEQWLARRTETSETAFAPV